MVLHAGRVLQVGMHTKVSSKRAVDGEGARVGFCSSVRRVRRADARLTAFAGSVGDKL